jgi:hypothetical protein
MIDKHTALERTQNKPTRFLLSDGVRHKTAAPNTSRPADWYPMGPVLRRYGGSPQS